jgi:DNA-binding NtrC family response regulator
VEEVDRAAGTVVLVDDEQMVVASLEGLLQLETSYRVLTFTSPEEALGTVERERPEAVVADFLMPGMDGIEFLERVRAVDPTSTRILLTGYADRDNAIRAINRVGLYHYLEKPWDNDRLMMVIRNGVERSSLFRRLDESLAELESVNEELHEMRLRLIRTFL